MTTLTIFDPDGTGFTVIARFRDHMEKRHVPTEAQAHELRDQLFEAGAASVRITGLPTRVAAGGFPRLHGPLPEVQD